MISQTKNPPRRFLIAIGCPTSAEYPLLERVESDIERVVALLTSPEQGYERVLADGIPLGASSTVIMQKINDWFGREERTQADCVVIYIAGHGDIRGNSKFHYLITSDTVLRQISTTAIKTAQLTEAMFESEVEHPQNVLLILDTCYSGGGSGQAAAALAQMKAEAVRGNGSGFYLIASADANMEASDGEFVDALLAVMEDDAWLPTGGTEYLNPLDLKEAINGWFKRHKRPQRCEADVIGSRERATFFRNPRYTRRFDGTELSDRTHWDPKARGVEGMGSPGWFFTGRSAALRELTAWLNADVSDLKARVVTGRPGSGKSAVLARLVLAAHSGTPSPPKKDAALDNNGGLLPAIGSVDVAIHARGARLNDIVAILAEKLDLRVQTAPEVLTMIRDRRKPVRIILDALDEAEDPLALERDLLAPLAASPCVRLVVGTRRRDTTVPLAGFNHIIDLDAPAYFDTNDIAAYVADLLIRRDPPTPYADKAHFEDARRIGKAVAHKAEYSFLYARVVTRWLSQASVAANTSQRNWESRLKLPEDLPQAFGEDLRRFPPDLRRKVFDVLVPLAYARGKGLPQKNVWYTVASQLSGSHYFNSDIREIKEIAGYYFIQDTEQGQTVYRLFHQAFADYLKDQTHDEDMELRFTEALLSLVPIHPGGSRNWKSATEPYLLYHFASHAAAADFLEAEMLDPGFLTTVPVDVLLAEGPGIVSAPGRKRMNAYRRASRWLRHQSNQAIALQYLMLNAQQEGADDLAVRIKAEVHDSPWIPEWAVWSQDATSYVIGDEGSPLLKFKAWQNDQGLPLAFCIYPEGKFCLWNLEEGVKVWETRVERPKGRHFVGGMSFPPSIKSIDVEQHGGGSVAVIAWEEGLLCFMDMKDGNEITWIDINETFAADNLHTDVTALCLLSTEEQLYLVTALETSEEKVEETTFSLCTWRLPGFQVMEKRESASKAMIYCLSTMYFGGEHVILSGSDTIARNNNREIHTVRMWRASDLTLLWEAPKQEYGTVSEVRPCSISGQEWILARSFTNHLTLYRPGTNAEVILADNVFRGISDLITCQSRADETWIIGAYNLHLRGFRIRYAGSEDHSLDIQPLPFSTQVQGNRWSDDLTIRGHACVVSADVGLCVWFLDELLIAETNTSLPDQIEKDTRFSAIAASRTHIAAGDIQRKIRVWDHAGRILWHRQLPLHSLDGITSLAIAEVDEIPILVVADKGGTLFMIDLLDGRDIHPPVKMGKWASGLSLMAIRGDLITFLCVNVGEEDTSKNYYIVRAWNVTTNEEFDTRMKEERSRRYYEASEGAEPWGLMLSGYYKTKTLYCAEAFSWSGGNSVAFAGPNAEIRVIDLETYDEIDCWQMGGSSTDYVTCLAVDSNENVPRVYSGNESGFISVHRTGKGKSHTTRCIEAHRSGVTGLQLCTTSKGTCLVSSGADGTVAFWKPDLTMLARIYTERPIHGIARSGEDHLAIANDRGVTLIHVDYGYM